MTATHIASLFVDITRRATRRRAVVLALMSVALSACGEDIVAPAPGPVVPPAVASVEIVGDAQPLTIGASRVLTTVVRDAKGASLTGRSVTWTSSNPAVATVSDEGSVVALGLGSTTIVASVGGKNGLRVLTVQPRPVSEISVPFEQLLLSRNDSRTIDATARDAQGFPISEVIFSWSSDDESVAVVTPTGRVVAMGSGTTTVRVSAAGRIATVQVTVPRAIVEVRVRPAAAVLRVGENRQYTATYVDDRGVESPATSVIWRSSSPDVAIIAGTGVLTATGRGYATISATVAGVTGSVALTVVSNNWHYEENLFSGRVLVRADTVNRSEHGVVVHETRMLNATLILGEHTGAWTLSVQLAHEERSEFLGNVMWRETGRETVVDYGTVRWGDPLDGSLSLTSSRTGQVQFMFTPAAGFGSLRGTVRGFPLAFALQLNR